MGHVEGVFVATEEDVEKIMGQEIYFGEILGKHSEVCFDMDTSNLTMVSNSPEVVKVIEDHGLESGYNPFAYWEEEEEEDYPGQGVDEGDEEPEEN